MPHSLNGFPANNQDTTANDKPKPRYDSALFDDCFDDYSDEVITSAFDEDVVQPLKPIKPKSRGYTTVSNWLLFDLRPTLCPSEWSVLSHIVAQTHGFRKTADSISYSQFTKGTNIKSRATINNALKSLQEKNLIFVHSGKQSKEPNRIFLAGDLLDSVQILNTQHSNNKSTEFANSNNSVETQWLKRLPESDIDDDYESAVLAARRKY